MKEGVGNFPVAINNLMNLESLYAVGGRLV